MAGKFFCTECGYEGEDPICPNCNIPTESLDFDETEVLENEEESYPGEVMDKVEEDDSEEDEKYGDIN